MKEEKEKKIGLFDFVNEINSKFGKINDITEYNPFIINKQFSYFRDTIFLANALNLFPGIDKDMQYEFYRHTVERGKRFSKWSKSEKSIIIDCLMDLCNIKKSEALLYESILDENTKAQILEYQRIKNGGQL